MKRIRIRIYRRTEWHQFPFDPERCAANVGDVYGSSQCLRKGRYEHMGYHYCSQHLKMIEKQNNPIATEAK